MKNLLVILMVSSSMATYSQTIIEKYYYPENGIKPISNVEIEAFKYLENAYIAFNNDNLVLTKKYLSKSEDNGVRSASFYYLLGLWAYKENKFNSAKRYWDAGYDNYGCLECQELKLGTKNRQSIDPIIIEQQRRWKNEAE